VDPVINFRAPRANTGRYALGARPRARPRAEGGGAPLPRLKNINWIALPVNLPGQHVWGDPWHERHRVRTFGVAIHGNNTISICMSCH